METTLRKKRIRRIALIALAVIAVAAAIFAIDFERADYKAALGDEIEKAQTLLLEAETGYQKGQYIPDIVVAFSQSIEEARTVYEDSSAVYEQHKSAYEALREDISRFKSSANRETIEPEDTAPKHNKSQDSDSKETKAQDRDAGSTEKHSSGQKSDTVSKPKTITVTIQIRCDNLSNDMSKLTDESKASWVPSNGVILGSTEYKCTKGTTVYDVLYAVCRNKNIHIESSYTPVYGSYYIEGINHIYEFDAGSESGWMYKVNGAYPDYGCSSYKLKDGDSIVWGYTCNLGKDLGNGY